MKLSFVKLILVLVIATSCLPVIIVGVPLISRIIDSSEKQALDKVQIKADLIERNLKTKLEQSATAFETLSKAKDVSLVMSSSLYGGTAREFIQAFLDTHRAFKSIVVTDGEGFQVESYPDDFIVDQFIDVNALIEKKLLNNSSATSYHTVRSARLSEEISSSPEESEKSTVIVFIKNVFDSKATLLGQVVGLLPLSELMGPVIQQIAADDHLRVELGNFPDAFQFGKLPDQYISHQSASLRLEEKTAQLTSFLHSLEVFVASDRKRDFATIEKLRNQLVALATSIVVISAFIGLIVARKLIYPIHKIGSLMNELSLKNYTTNMPSLKFKEFDSLLATISTLTNSIRNYQTTLETKVGERTKELHRKNRDIQSILSNIDLGLLSFDKDFLIQPDYAFKTNEIFNCNDLALKDFRSVILNRFKLTNNKLTELEHLLRGFFNSDRLTFEINRTHLPQEVTIECENKKKYLRIMWDAIENEKGYIDRLLVTIDDITAALINADTGAKQRLNNTVLSELLSFYRPDTKTIIEQVIDATENFCRNKRNNLVLTSSDERELHTLKGNASSCGFKLLAEAIHKLELSYKDDKTFEKDCIENLNLVLHSYSRTIKEKIKPATEHFENQLNHVYSALEERLSDQDRDLPGDIRALIQSRDYVDIARLIDQILSPTKDKALLYHLQEPSFNLECSHISITKKYSGELLAIFTHLLNNSLAHSAPNYSENAAWSIFLKVSPADDYVRFTYYDSGKGIDVKALASKYHLSESDTEAIADAMLIKPQSSKGEINTISGMGQGLSAIRGIIEKLGGEFKMTIKPKSKSNQMLLISEFSIPASFFVKTIDLPISA